MLVYLLMIAITLPNGQAYKFTVDKPMTKDQCEQQVIDVYKEHKVRAWCEPYYLDPISSDMNESEII